MNDTKSLKINAYSKLFLMPFVLGLAFFLPAGTFDYWQAWVYMAVIGIPAFFLIKHMLKYNQELMRRRMQFKEKEKTQTKLVNYGSIIYIFLYLLPGFDRRFIWSSVPDWLVIISNIIVFLGYLIVIVVFKQNSYASRIVEVEEGQTVITNGLYSVVRHPMYIGTLLMMLATPLALGSYWALIPAMFMPGILIIRIFTEEKVLRKNLIGYNEYCEKTKYRLIPFIW
ncbi:MAG: isoprenylcysteine carboxylmethyltransferase family protein [bacterium]